MSSNMRDLCLKARLDDINTHIPQEGRELRRANTTAQVATVNKTAHAPIHADACVRIRGNTDYIPGRTDYAIAYNTVKMGITRGDIRCTHDEAMLLVQEYLRIKSMRVSLKALRELVIADPDMAEEYMPDIEGLEVMVEIAYGKMAKQGWSMPR